MLHHHHDHYQKKNLYLSPIIAFNNLKTFENSIFTNLPYEHLAEIIQKYKLNMGKKGTSKKSHSFAELKTKVKSLLKDYPHGLQLEKFSSAFKQKFAYFLNPQNFNYDNIIKLLNSKELKEIIQIQNINDEIVIFNSGNI